MEFTAEDRQAYGQHLQKTIREENRKQLSIAKMFNLNNLYTDLNDLEGNTKK